MIPLADSMELKASEPSPSPSVTPDEPYSEWKQGHANESMDGEMQVVEYEGETALQITSRNAYMEIDPAVVQGNASFSFDVYVDTSVDRNFRVYLENTVTEISDPNNIVFAELINNRNSQVNAGPGIDVQNNPLFTYAQLGESQWVHFDIELDYTAADSEFITMSAAKADGTPLGEVKMSAIDDKDTSLRSIRLVQTAAACCFANMSFTCSPQPTAPPPTASPTPRPTIDPSITPDPAVQSWTFDSIDIGTTYESGDTISGVGGGELAITKAEADTIPPTVKERAAGDGYLEFNDATTAGTVRQAGWAYTPSVPMEGDRITVEFDFIKGDTDKDTILFRAFDSVNADSSNTYASDGRVFEVKTGEDGSLKLSDYFSAGSAGKPLDIDISGVTLRENTWYGLRVVYTKADDTVKVYFKTGSGEYSLKSTVVLGSGTKMSGVTEVPALSLDKLMCVTPGGGSVVYGVDNIWVENYVYVPEDVSVTGEAYTLFSHDLKNSLEPFDSTIAGTLEFTKSGETEPYATTALSSDGTYSTELETGSTYTVEFVPTSGTAEYTLSPMSLEPLDLKLGEESGHKNLLFMKNREPVEYKDTVYVGADKEYKNLNEAMADIRTMVGREENGVQKPVTIILDPGTYYGQVIIDVPHITIKSADPSNRAVLSNYYGIGYVYYSMGDNSYYNADYAAAKIRKNTATRWGATVRVTGDYFTAEDIYFDNTFNQVVTDAELADGVEPGGGSRKDFTRAPGANVRTKAATERAAALAVDADYCEIIGCKMVSSQDTLYTGGMMYFKDCEIYGNTDYIFGGDNVVFDSCDLVWYGYSGSRDGGHITANKNGSETDAGYFLTGCTVKRNPDSSMSFGAGTFGRNWGGGLLSKVFFYDTTIADGVDLPSTWSAMGGSVSESPLYAVNTHREGSASDLTTSSSYNPHGTATSVPTIADYFGDWVPSNYSAE